MNKKAEFFIDVIEKALVKLKASLNDVVEEKEETSDPTETTDFFEPAKEVNPVLQDNTALNHCLSINVINNPNWPQAVPQDLICDLNSEDDLIGRAGSLIDQMVDTNLKDKHFLDFGCGDGYVAYEATQREVATSTGYDIVKNDVWDKINHKNGLLLTDDLKEISEKEYDVIFIHDVLDHADKPLELLSNVRKILSKDGVVYLRCHPWSSRTGLHLHRTLNKAYIHLAVQEEVLRKTGHSFMKTKKILRPVVTYREWFTKMKFTIKRENVLTEPRENFFREDKIRNLLHKHWGSLSKELSPDDIDKILEINFVDYTLKKC